MKHFMILVLMSALFFSACSGGSKNDKQNKITLNEPQTNLDNKVAIDTVSVSSIEDFVSNAKSNSVILVSKGDYTLDEDKVYYMKQDEQQIIDKKLVETRSIGGQLYLSGLNNIQFVGEEGARFLSNNPKATALYVVQGENISFKNISFGHNTNINPEPKAGGAFLASSNKLSFDKCEIVGSPIGLSLTNVIGLDYINSRITGCTKSIVRMTNSTSVSIQSSQFTNNTCTEHAFNFYGTDNNAHIINLEFTNNTAVPVKDKVISVFSLKNNSMILQSSIFRNNSGFSNLGVSAQQALSSEVSGLKYQ